MNSKTFCIVPFIGGCIKPNGTLSACCQSKDQTSYQYDQLDDWRNNVHMRELRKSLYNGEQHPWCQRCWTSQSAGQTSLRESYNSSLANKEIVQAVQHSAANDFEVSEPVQFLDLKLGNLCNLRCVMCGPESSSRILTEQLQNIQWFPQAAEFSEVDFAWPETKQFRDSIEPHLSTLKYVKFTGGEPMLNPWIEYFLELLPAQCVVHVVTNATLIDSNKIKLLKKFDQVWLTLSVDATGDLYQHIRYPASWQRVSNNIEYLLEQLPQANTWFAVTVGLLSLIDIDTTLNHLCKWKDKVDLIIISDPAYLSVHAIPDTMFEDIEHKIQKINNLDYRIQLQRILATRKHTPELWTQFKQHMQRMSTIRHYKNLVLLNKYLDA